MLALGIGYMKVVDDNDNLMAWPIIYTPQSNGTVLSPDNYLHTVRHLERVDISMGKRSKRGYMKFYDKRDKLTASLTLQRT